MCSSFSFSPSGADEWVAVAGGEAKVAQPRSDLVVEQSSEEGAAQDIAAKMGKISLFEFIIFRK